MENSENMGEQETRLLALEAILIRHQADLEALQEVVFQYLEAQGAKYRNSLGEEVSAREHNNALASQILRGLIAHLAEGDAHPRRQDFKNFER